MKLPSPIIRVLTPTVELTLFSQGRFTVIWHFAFITKMHHHVFVLIVQTVCIRCSRSHSCRQLRGRGGCGTLQPNTTRSSPQQPMPAAHVLIRQRFSWHRVFGLKTKVIIRFKCIPCCFPSKHHRKINFQKSTISGCHVRLPWSTMIEGCKT